MSDKTTLRKNKHYRIVMEVYNMDKTPENLQNILTQLDLNDVTIEAKNYDFPKYSIQESDLFFNNIMEVVSDYFLLTLDELVSKCRETDIINARKVVCHIARINKDYKYTLKYISSRLGGITHPSLLNYTKGVAVDLFTNYKPIVNAINHYNNTQNEG
tara:strand:- start:818 stop:1291 length:474 start_codon:yes stop_codon:yes gene_type:complete